MTRTQPYWLLGVIPVSPVALPSFLSSQHTAARWPRAVVPLALGVPGTQAWSVDASEILHSSVDVPAFQMHIDAVVV